jgi:hypothetical protein
MGRPVSPVPVVATGAVALFAAARVVPFARAHFGISLDSLDYLKLAREDSVFGNLAGHRPPVYLLVLRLFAENRQAVTWFQLAIAIGAWAWLAFATARCLRTPLGRAVGFTAVLLLGSCLDTTQWDRLIDTESLSISLGVMIVAAVLWWGDGLTTLGTASLATLVVLWAMLRDANALVVGAAGVAVVITSLAFRRRIERPVLVVACLAIACTFGAVVSGDIGNRWQQPLQNVVTFRVLESPARESFFLRHGLPLSPAEARDLAGRCANPAGTLLCKTVTSRSFYDWIDQEARAVYIRSWFAFPATTLAEPLTHVRRMTGGRLPVGEITGTGLESSYAGKIEGIVFPRSPRVLLALLAVLAIASVLTIPRRTYGRLVGVALALLGLAYVHLWVVWTGDAVELERHGLVAAIQIVLGLWLLAVGLLDALVASRPRHRNAVRATERR